MSISGRSAASAKCYSVELQLLVAQPGKSARHLSKFARVFFPTFDSSCPKGKLWCVMDKHVLAKSQSHSEKQSGVDLDLAMFGLRSLPNSG